MKKTKTTKISDECRNGKGNGNRQGNRQFGVKPLKISKKQAFQN